MVIIDPSWRQFESYNPLMSLRALDESSLYKFFKSIQDHYTSRKPLPSIMTINLDFQKGLETTIKELENFLKELNLPKFSFEYWVEGVLNTIIDGKVNRSIKESARHILEKRKQERDTLISSFKSSPDQEAYDKYLEELNLKEPVEESCTIYIQNIDKQKGTFSAFNSSTGERITFEYFLPPNIEKNKPYRAVFENGELVDLIHIEPQN